MKKKLRIIILAILSFVFFQTTLAQNYQPFKLNFDYHFIAQDSIYALGVDSAYIQSGDSVFVFNKTSRAITAPVPGGCIAGLQQKFVIHENNQFGKHVKKKANGEFQFETASGAVFLLKTKATIGQTWIFNGTLTATLTARTYESFLTASDSVLVFTLSNGNIIKLSKNYGFTQVPNFVSYHDSYFSPKQLSIYKLPENDKRKNVASVFKIYDFQPNDQFGYYITSLTSPCNTYQWRFEKILTRNVAPNGNSITYTKEIWQKTIKTGQTICASGPTITGPVISTFTVSLSDDIKLNIYNNSFLKYSFDSRVATNIYKSPTLNNREVMNHQELQFDGCNNTFIERWNFGKYYSYATGLGQIEHFDDADFYGKGLNKLECYTKGSETYGNCQNFLQLITGISEDKKLAPALSIFPNPAENRATLNFDASLTSGKVSITILNALGQVVLEQQFTEIPDQQLQLSLEKLTKGMYIVQVQQQDQTYFSRLVKQ